MRRRRLGAEGPEISVIGLGAWEAGGEDWGPNVSEDGVIAALRAGIEAGIDWVDTAEVYGSGVSETLVGRAVAGRRDEVIVATKVAPADEGSGFHPEQVLKACDGSLTRLGIDRIDLYQLHWPDPFGTPVEETWGAMCELQDAGKVRWIGVSNFDQELIDRCEAIRHVDSLQPEFSMVALEQRDLIRWCGEHGIGVVTYSPIGAGLLTGSIPSPAVFPEDDWRREAAPFLPANLDRNLAMVEAMRPIAERLGLSLAQLALAWNVAQPGVTSAIAGSRDAGHIRDNAAAGDVALDTVTLGELESLFA